MDIKVSRNLGPSRLKGADGALSHYLAQSPECAPAALSWERDSYSSTAMFETMNRSLHAGVARYTLGLSPLAMMAAFQDWSTGLAFSPGKQAQLVEKAVKKWMKFVSYGASVAINGKAAGCCIEPLRQDQRFRADAWQRLPFSLNYQAFLLTQQWWHNATTGIDGVTAQHERAIEFAARQILDVVSPSNFLPTNPEILQRTLKEGGMNLLRGLQNMSEDWQRAIAGKKPAGTEDFVTGKNLAATPGKVVFRNRLIELIQYAPTKDKVHPEPILFVPAWIMKYYILDLSPDNSMVRYLLDQGYTVFMISWKNPGAEDRDLGLADYFELGVSAALDRISEIVPERGVHGVGYCLGGTLLAIAAAAMAKAGDDRLKTLSFLAAQVDFEEAGEIMLFINEKQVSFLEDMMWEQGFLDSHQMAGAFQMLRSSDLIWSKMVHDYLMGERRPMTDLMAWNADATRMPYRMHSEYLRQLFLNNDLAEGRFRVGGDPVAISDIHTPLFVVGTERDHVAPWRSVYKFHLLSDTEVRFLLTSGGHNAGIVSEPGHPNRHYRVSTTGPDDVYVDPDEWLARAELHDGSWWPEWQAWLAAHNAEPEDPPGIGGAGERPEAMPDAPGLYVLQT